MASTANYFNHTEEAFLLSSLHEVVKVWARGSGQANFGLNVSNGSAELNLSFTLGHPSDLHHVPPQFNHPNPDQDQEQHSRKKKMRRKTAARRERDRARAQAYQASQEIRQFDLILPLAGKLLPVNKEPSYENATAVPAPRSATPSLQPAATSRPLRAVAAVTPPVAATPTLAELVSRKSESYQKKYFDVSAAKKQLFPNPQESPPSRQKKSFQMKEADLWTKLFN